MPGPKFLGKVEWKGRLFLANWNGIDKNASFARGIERCVELENDEPAEGLFALLRCLFVWTTSQDRYQFLASKRRLGNGHSNEFESRFPSFGQFLLHRG